MKIKKKTAIFLSFILVLSILSESTIKAVEAGQNTQMPETPTRVNVHDPSILKAEDGTYYVFGSHIKESFSFSGMKKKKQNR